MLHSAVLAWLRLYRVVQRIDRAQTASLRVWNLNTAQFDVLARVGSHEGITQQELADNLLVTKGNISQLLDRMEQRGLLRRCQEKRRKVLMLTEQGQELYDLVVPAQERFIEEQMSALSATELMELRHLVRRLDQGLRR